MVVMELIEWTGLLEPRSEPNLWDEMDRKIKGYANVQNQRRKLKGPSIQELVKSKPRWVAAVIPSHEGSTNY